MSIHHRSDCSCLPYLPTGDPAHKTGNPPMITSAPWRQTSVSPYERSHRDGSSRMTVTARILGAAFRRRSVRSAYSYQLTPIRSNVRSLPKASDLARSSACTIKQVLEVFMTTYLRTITAITSLLILAACAANTAGVKPNAAAPGAVAHNSACLSQTGSRIAGNDANCTAIGRSYSSDDIDRTGSTTAGEALRLLDPSITVHH